MLASGFTDAGLFSCDRISRRHSFASGCLYHDKLLSVEGAAIGFGAVLCVLASIAKDRIDRETTL